jgi:hypothetical protein
VAPCPKLGKLNGVSRVNTGEVLILIKCLNKVGNERQISKRFRCVPDRANLRPFSPLGVRTRVNRFLLSQCIERCTRC